MTYRIPKLALSDIVAIYWFDAHQKAESGGTANEVLESECNLVDIGFFVGCNKRYVVIATEVDLTEGNTFRHMHYIPKVNITRIDKIGRP